MAFLMSSKFLVRNLVVRIPKRHGYIVLVPEIGEDLPEKNPLLQRNGLPEFNNITIENCMAAIGKQTLEFEADVKKIDELLQTTNHLDIFEDILNPLERSGTCLDMAWGLSKTLYLGNSSLMPTKSYLSIHDRAKRARSAKFNAPNIYGTLLETNCDTLNVEQKRVVKKFTLEGKLNGLSLHKDKTNVLHAYLHKLAEHSHDFKMRTGFSTNRFNIKIHDPQIVQEFPVSVAQMMSTSNSATKGPWIATLDSHIRIPFMEYCPVREYRKRMWEALVSRGSTYGESELQTSTTLEHIRSLRQEQANLLGYKNFVDMSMETKMVGNKDHLFKTLNSLLEHAKIAQEKEIDSLYKYAKSQSFEGNQIELWDVAFWRRKLCKSVYNFSEESFQKYFPLSKVLEGLFYLCEQLFMIKIRQRSNVSAWHKDVRYYDIFENNNLEPVAGFYLDPYARSNEKLYTRQNLGWMVGIQSHSVIAETKPLSALIFNFQPPSTDRPSLLTFKDLQTLFHRFGQNLQHLLSRTQYSEVSGLSNVEWDAVEISGNMLCHWLLNKSTIVNISSHFESGDNIPDHMYEALVKVTKTGAGLELGKEIYLSLLDMELHSSEDFWLEIVRRLWPQCFMFPLADIDSHPCSFTQIFCEEWAAAYYSHLWSRIIAADVYSAFHEVQDNQQEISNVGRRYRDTFLALGGSCHPSEIFRTFRGRDPSPIALLASLDLKLKPSS